jgi:hypothetical protein
MGFRAKRAVGSTYTAIIDPDSNSSDDADPPSRQHAIMIVACRTDFSVFVLVRAYFCRRNRDSREL